MCKIKNKFVFSVSEPQPLTNPVETVKHEKSMLSQHPRLFPLNFNIGKLNVDSCNLILRLTVDKGVTSNLDRSSGHFCISRGTNRCSWALNPKTYGDYLNLSNFNRITVNL